MLKLEVQRDKSGKMSKLVKVSFDALRGFKITNFVHVFTLYTSHSLHDSFWPRWALTAAKGPKTGKVELSPLAARHFNRS